MYGMHICACCWHFVFSLVSNSKKNPSRWKKKRKHQRTKEQVCGSWATLNMAYFLLTVFVFFKRLTRSLLASHRSGLTFVTHLTTIFHHRENAQHTCRSLCAKHCTCDGIACDMTNATICNYIRFFSHSAQHFNRRQLRCS